MPTHGAPDALSGEGAFRRITSLILAAGSGTRMGAAGQHKVCRPLNGRPVIARAVEAYARCGAGAHVIVVGAMAEQVMQALDGAPGAHAFCRQPRPRGTGHAARMGAQALEATGYADDVLVAAGDKVLEDAPLCRLLATFRRENADMAFLTGPVSDFPTAGRVLTDARGAPVAIAEVFDIARARLLADLRRRTGDGPIPARDVRALALGAFGGERKADRALGALWEDAQHGVALTAEILQAHFPDAFEGLRMGGRDIPLERLEAAREANLSVYLFRAPALYEALAHIGAENAQGEEYLTDTIAALSALGRRIVTVAVERPTEAMAYNTPEEFRRIEQHWRHRAEAGAAPPVRSVSAWQNALESPGFDARLRALYGPNGVDLATKKAMILSALEEYARRFGDGPVAIARAPGRINIMGRHVDHQGGVGNLIAINRDTFAVMGAREDQTVHLCSAEPDAFPPQEFTIPETLQGYAGGDWLSYVDSPDGQAQSAKRRGEWGLYVRAAVARFQAGSARPLRGFQAVVAGDIPIAAGLSSSSALVVATATGLCALNGLSHSPVEFVALCGEAEWYAGTRGGAGDHAAMVFGQRGHVARFAAHPLRLLDSVPLPEDAVFLVCDSHVKARKTDGARDAFNHRVACYHIGRELIRLRRPDLAPRIRHLRDVNAATLGCTPAEIIGLLGELPEVMTRDDVRKALGAEVAEPIFASHAESVGPYPVRAVVIYGLAECARGMAAGDLLRAGDLEAFGRWMNVSHNGDRAVRRTADGAESPFCPGFDGAAMAEWLARAEAGVPEAELAEQPGFYGCGCPAVDAMVDIALAIPGVMGAQISGAGLGGCMMALARRDAIPALERAMAERFYAPRSLTPRMFACVPVAGSGLLQARMRSGEP